MTLDDPLRPKINDTPAYVNSQGHPIAPFHGYSISPIPSRYGYSNVSFLACMAWNEFSYRSCVVENSDIEALLFKTHDDLELAFERYFGYIPPNLQPRPAKESRKGGLGLTLEDLGL